MKVRKALNDLVRLIADEAEKNPDFESRIAAALGLAEQPKLSTRRDTGPQSQTTPVSQRPRNRRPPPVLNPIEIAKLGEAALRTRLAGLHIEQLRDIVADFGMDPGKLVLKWKTADRIIDRIVETSLTRAQKGDAFRSDGYTREESDIATTEDAIEYQGYRLLAIKDGEGWRIQINPGTATAMPPATNSIKHSDREGAIANAKMNLDSFLAGKRR